MAIRANWIIRFSSTLVFAVVACVLVAVATLYGLQDRMIFPAPTTALGGTLPSGWEQQKIVTDDGETLLVLVHPPEPGEAAIIVFHGNADLAVWQLGRGQRLANAGFGVLLAEYRGYGGSSGTPSETGLVEDALTAYDHLRKTHKGPIAINAHSLGTGVAFQLAAKREIAAMALDAPFDSLLAVAAARFSPLPVNGLVRHPFRSDDVIGSLDRPILIMHGTADRVVPVDHGRRLAQLGGTNVTYLEIKGAGHHLVGHGSIDRAIAFFRRVLAPE